MEVPPPPASPPRFGHLLEQLTEFREKCLPVYYIIKDTDEQLDGEVPRARSGRVPRTGASVPLQLGCATLLRVDMFIDLLVVDQTLYKWDFYRDFITEE